MNKVCSDPVWGCLPCGVFDHYGAIDERDAVLLYTRNTPEKKTAKEEDKQESMCVQCIQNIKKIGVGLMWKKMHVCLAESQWVT